MSSHVRGRGRRGCGLDFASMNQIRIRVDEAPVGGARIAWSYLGTVIGLLVGGVFWSIWTPFSGAVCGDGDDILCELGWGSAGIILGAALGLTVGAFVFRLGWEWWAVLAGLLFGSPFWFDAPPEPVRFAVAILAPALAAVATWSGPRRPAWRPWVIGIASATLVTLGLLSVFA